ncbi:MAG: hypothetical protein HFJ28_00470 [Clostridia bacterium]|nr:hypothetical protein [Clostridia bacterium]
MNEVKFVKRISLSSCRDLNLTVHGSDDTELGSLEFRTGDSIHGALYMTYLSKSKNNSIALSELREALLLLADHLKEPPKVVVAERY